jgi:hypothetical protein
LNKAAKLLGWFDFINRLRRNIGLLFENFIFHSQTRRTQRQAIQGFDFQIYSLTPGFPAHIQRAAQWIEKDERSAKIVRGYVRAVVEIESEAKLASLGGAGMAIGVRYDYLPPEFDTEVAQVALACTLVQFAVSRKLLLRLGERCPNRRNAETEKHIKRISVRAMHAFTVRTELGERYSYEIECKLKNGAYDC